MPIEAVSPSPLTPSAIRLRLASIAPVATDGMRPCTELKLCERFMKYAGLFEEQPVPLILITRSGCTPISYMASMMRSEMALWPQPAHSVVLPPLYSRTLRPMRLVFGPGAELGSAVGVVTMLFALHAAEFVGDGARIERQSVEVRQTAQARGKLRFQIEFEQTEHLCVAVLFDYINAVVLLNEIVHLARERIRAKAQVIGFDVIFVAQLVAAFGDGPMRRAITENSDARVVPFCNFRTRNEGTSGFECAIQSLHVVGVVVGALAVRRFLVVPAAARKIRCGRMCGARQRAIADTVSVHIFVAGKSSQPIQIFFAQHLAAIDGRRGIFE